MNSEAKRTILLATTKEDIIVKQVVGSNVFSYISPRRHNSVLYRRDEEELKSMAKRLGLTTKELMEKVSNEIRVEI